MDFAEVDRPNCGMIGIAFKHGMPVLAQKFLANAASPNLICLDFWAVAFVFA